jgi:diacylglycerol kinase family enzyme
MQTPPARSTAPPLIIVNPAAGRGRTARGLPGFLRALRQTLGDVDVAETAGRGDATALAAAAAGARRPLVVSLGGDGTLNEVVNGLLSVGGTAGGTASGAARSGPRADDLPVLGIVATGTGGDFGRSLGLAHRFEAYLGALAAGVPRTVDLGRARFVGLDGRPVERYWVNVLSAGIGGVVDRYAAAAPRFLGGRLAYAQATLRGIFTCRRAALRCRAVLADGSETDRRLDAWAVAVCNGGTFGGGMSIAPMARVDDGLLEVITVETDTRRTMLRRFTTIYSGTHLQQQGVGHFSCRSLELTPLPAEAGGPAGRRPAGLFPLDVDGDALGDVPLRIDVVPRALRVLGPAGPALNVRA